MRSDLSDEFLLQAGVHQGSVLLLLPFAIAVDASTKYAKEGSMNEFFYADDFGFNE